MKITIAVVAVLFGLYLTASWHEPMPMYIGFGVAGFIWIKSLKVFGDGVSNIQKEWNDQVAGSDYQHFYKDTGIALNSKTSQIYLRSKEKFKAYAFNEIRGWNYSINTGGQMVGGNVGMAGIGHNIRQNRENKASSGLFLTVKDIDNPEWRVAFPWSETNNKKTEIELKRWMEIFQQNINEK